jgi:hypothetical protein
VGASRIAGHDASPDELEVDPAIRNRGWYALRPASGRRRGEAPGCTDRTVLLTHVGDSHGGSLSAPWRVGHDCREMPRVQFKSLDAPDEVRRVPNGTIEIYTLDDIVIGRTVFEPGWHWAEDVKPIAGTELCQYHHVGVCISGRLSVRMADGTTSEVSPGTVFDIPPGHDGWVVGDEPWVTYDVAGMRAFARVEEGSQRVLGAVLFTDIVDSTATAERIGATRWKALVDAHNERFQFELDRFRGRLIKPRARCQAGGADKP